MTDVQLLESVRSRAWAAAKKVALEQWQNGSADTTQMLIAASRGLDAALYEVLAGESQFHTDDCRCRQCEGIGANGWAFLNGPPRRARRAAGGDGA